MELTAKFLILSGDGINCENETKLAFSAVGINSDIMHINDLCLNPKKLLDYDGLALPGGFSFGDELGAGLILAHKIRHHLWENLLVFLKKERPVIGICNGFQALVRLGLLPFADGSRKMSLAPNKQAQFINKWESLNVDPTSVCQWTKYIATDKQVDFALPIRHGEGRIVFAAESADEIYNQLKAAGQIPLTYKSNVNGSYQNIAAITDEKGLILGMMPHPEAFMYMATYNKQTAKSFDTPGNGYELFNSIAKYFKNN